MRTLIACEDINERKRAQHKLQRSEAFLARGQEISRTGSFGWSVLSGEVFWSDETFRIFEYDLGSTLTLRLVLERVHPEDRAFVQQTIQRASLDTRLDFEHRLLMPDGRVKHLHVLARAQEEYLHSGGYPVLKESGDLVEFVGTTMDITEQWKAREDLKKAFEEIKRLKDLLHDENLVLREQIDQALMFGEIVGDSPALRAVLFRVSKVAPTPSTVLITGETGTGKELIARAVHKLSQRSSRAFVSVNCAATPRDLIASELFGHVKGAFTGATQQRAGRFELAKGGTIFLDEVGEPFRDPNRAPACFAGTRVRACRWNWFHPN